MINFGLSNKKDSIKKKTMTEDNLILLCCYAIYALTLLTLILRSKERLKSCIINLTVLGLYSGFFFYNLTFNSAGGSSLVWLVNLMFAIGLHWLINLIGIILTFIKKRDTSNE